MGNRKPTMLNERLRTEIEELARPAEPIQSHPEYNAEKHELMKKGLTNILGEEYVSDDPEITQAYSRDWSSVLFQMRPEFVALPGSVEDVQAIVRLACRLKFPLIPIGTGFIFMARVNRLSTVVLDMVKRMNRIVKLDARNMYAVVEPGVTYAQLHAEAIKKGLTHHGAPSSGSQSKVLANVLGIGAVNSKGHRYGYGPHNILGVEMVLPSGDLIWIGSPAMPGAEYFWGEGPGPDLRGIVANKGSFGTTGVITKMAYKLHPWPGPSTWPAEDYLPHIKTKLPEDKHRGYLIKFPTYEKLVDALYEIGRCEIGYSVHSLTAHQCAGWHCRSSEEFYELYFKEKYYQEWEHLLVVHLVALTSLRQLEYEEKVLKQIVEQYEGIFIPLDERAKDWLETAGIDWGYADAHGCRTLRYTGTYAGFLHAGALPLDLLAEVCRKDSWQLQIRDKYHPPLVDVVPYDAIIWPMEFSHYGLSEQNVFPEKTPEKVKAALEANAELMKESLKRNDIYGLAGMHVTEEMRNLIMKIKQAFDPANIANPPLPLEFFPKEMKKIIEETMKKMAAKTA